MSLQSQIIHELHQRLCSFVKEEQVLGSNDDANDRATEYILRIAKELEQVRLDNIKATCPTYTINKRGDTIISLFRNGDKKLHHYTKDSLVEIRYLDEFAVNDLGSHWYICLYIDSTRETYYIPLDDREGPILKARECELGGGLPGLEDIWDSDEMPPLVNCNDVEFSQREQNTWPPPLEITEDEEYYYHLNDKVFRPIDEVIQTDNEMPSETQMTISQALAFASKVHADAYQVHRSFCEALASASKALSIAADVVVRAHEANKKD